VSKQANRHPKQRARPSILRTNPRPPWPPPCRIVPTSPERTLTNFAVGCLENDEVYAEVGCYHGATLIGALLNQPTAKALAADNFSEFDLGGG
jgi:hypothetical protein